MKTLRTAALVFALVALVTLRSLGASPAIKCEVKDVFGFKTGSKPNDLPENTAIGLPNTYSVNGRREADPFGFDRYLIKFSTRSGMCAVTAVHFVNSLDEATAFARGVMRTLVVKYGEGSIDKGASGNNLLVANWGTKDAGNSIQLVVMKNPTEGKVPYFVTVIFCYPNFGDYLTENDDLLPK